MGLPVRAFHALYEWRVTRGEPQPQLPRTLSRVSQEAAVHRIAGIASALPLYRHILAKTGSITQMTLDWTALGIQLSATGAVFYGTLRLFKEIEDRLHPDTKLAISVWLLDAEDKVNLCADWPTTCYSMFIQVFGSGLACRGIDWAPQRARLGQ